jgi:uncharacterized protein (TIGR02246 family)
VRLSLWSVFMLSLIAAGRGHAAEACAKADEAAVAALFDDWNVALATLSPEKVAQRYWEDAVLLPTLSNTPRTTPAMMREYFTHFLEQHPRGRIDARTIHIDCNMAVDAGAYTFSMMDARGKASEVAARYTYVYAWRQGGWKILHHHSSGMPEVVRAEPKAPAPSIAHGRQTAAGGSRPFLNIDASPRVDDFYPSSARARREEGAVSMQVCASPVGDLTNGPEVLQSSGFARLDEAAQAWARAARWIPATRDNKPVDGCTKISVLFQAPA